MAVNLATKYSDKIAQAFSLASFLKGRASGEYDWEGVKAVKVYTPQTVDLNDYTRSGTNRYGSPTEVGDIVQELILTQDKSFSLTVDKGNNTEQMGVKNAGKVLNLQIKEKVVPTADKYAFGRFIKYAGTVSGVSAPTKATVVSLIGDVGAALDDALVPADGRTVYATSNIVKLIIQSPEFVGLQTLGAKAVGKGVVGEILGMEVVKVPSSYFPEGAYLLVAHKSSILHPIKLNDSKLHIDPPGLSGHLLEGRTIFDAFVLGARCGGVYAAVDSSKKLATPTLTKGSGVYTMACTGADSILYTIDGTDPRYSSTALTYSGAVSTSILASGVTVKVVGLAAASFTSDVLSSTLS